MGEREEMIRVIHRFCARWWNDAEPKAWEIADALLAAGFGKVDDEKTIHVSAVEWADILAEARAKAWDEGYDRGIGDSLLSRKAPNPYRAEATS